MLHPFAFRKSLALSALAAVALLAGCASTLPGQGPVPAAAETWTKPGATLQDTQQALQACGYVDRFSVGYGWDAWKAQSGLTAGELGTLKRMFPEIPRTLSLGSPVAYGSDDE